MYILCEFTLQIKNNNTLLLFIIILKYIIYRYTHAHVCFFQNIELYAINSVQI